MIAATFPPAGLCNMVTSPFAITAGLIRNRLAAGLMLLAAASLAACVPTLVQPHDPALVAGVESLYATAATMIDDGVAASPRTDAEREAIRPATASAGHFSRFASRYDALIRASDLMILRAMAGGAAIDGTGEKLQGRIEQLIENAIPSVCAELTETFDALGASSLTVRNHVDLKCLLTRWKEQHADPALTRGSLILKRANWESRRASLFRVVLAIQRAELAKQPPTR
ncbi:MAG: hypothetical protein C0434_16675 [Xanthomonadaceae bacterium]|nr:hypothetical protein [Xanthomonadaceae bacterium]